MSRRATIKRETKETQIELSLDLDGKGKSQISTGVGFLDHMLTLFAVHSRFDLSVTAKGDLHIDDHHTVEDVGICLGMALGQCVGDRKGIFRYGHFTLPMDETLVTTACDLGGRTSLVWKVDFSTENIGTFDTQLIEEFWNAVVQNARMNFHSLLHHGRNSHHISEAVFKSAARAIRQACTIDPSLDGEVASSKGVL